ncbi:hypothetical protein GF406_25655 [candidate division KSB1 bacterium]|nr:hypothetical protein [candidate division KSB1 bacterium]
MTLCRLNCLYWRHCKSVGKRMCLDFSRKRKVFKRHLFIIFFLFFLILSGPVSAKNNIELSLDRAVEITMNNSYRIRRLELGIERTLFWLRAQRANLKSSVSLNLQTPDLSRISDYKWNSTLQRDEIVRQNTERWQAILSVRQPVILFNYPTNGYISLNYKVYRYTQRDNGDKDVDYYNRVFVKYAQPFFRPNSLKNNLEDAELNLELNKVNYTADRVNIMEHISGEYYDLFQLEYQRRIYEKQLKYLERLKSITDRIVARDSSRAIERIQVELEIANVQENVLENKSQLRRERANMKQRLRLSMDDSLIVEPRTPITEINIDLEQAIEYGYESSPHLRRLRIYKRKSEIDVEQQKGRNSFHMTLEMTYGLERQENKFIDIWEDYDNSNSITLNAHIPLWDWGERNARIQAEQMEVKQRLLDIEEHSENIRKNVINTFTNLNEYQERTLNMKNSLRLAQELLTMSLQQYANSEISIQDVLQIITRQKETDEKFIVAYLGYRRALLNLMVLTHYDFEKDQSLSEGLVLKKAVSN